jgi:hypothetical protein
VYIPQIVENFFCQHLDMCGKVRIFAHMNKKRLDIRIADIKPELHQLLVRDSKLSNRTITRQAEYMLMVAYGLLPGELPKKNNLKK